MTKKQRRTFNAEFTLQVVQMIREQGLSEGDVCLDMKLGETAARRWRYPKECIGLLCPQASMSYPFVEQLHKKAVTAERLCRVLGVSRSGYCGFRRRGIARTGAAYRTPPRAALDAREQAAGAMAAQVRSHHRQRSRAAGLGQPAGATLQPERPQQGLGERHHVHPNAQWLAAPGRGAGPVCAQGRGLGDGADHARRTGARGGV